jgi:hypothetical protein
MKILRYLMVAILIVGMSGVARASGFSWNLQDPTSTDFPFFVLVPGQTSFSFGFANCDLPLNGVVYTGCAVGLNLTGQTLTTIGFNFANANGLDGAPADCTSDAFSDISCGPPSNDVYSLTFNDDCGSKTCGIPDDHFFVILENGLPGGDFPDVAGVANPTPELSSIWLALSGMGSLGYLVRRRRKTSNG